ncbi:DUF7192 family protein [Bizionia myxarmorum]|uniref:DUF7192 domain-containing protein n=1 Tax=Bizionia myxarmorum TaxID=291186 RepID=A0A5D0RA39_9FLAO|nr:hypothetical protein [Bizionia myxarmorum]TYB78347.1 hypothetical protein ES674_00775 [Bizionia myxarmorum]
MPFNFLPDNTNPEPKPSTEGQPGGQFNVGKNVFYDDYLSHLDAHNLFSTPPKRSEFKLNENYKIAKDFFSNSSLEWQILNNFYGPETEVEKLSEGYTQFQKPNLLNETINNLNAEIKEDLFSSMEKPKMKINDRFGMFSFDLASMAMTYIYEYFKVSNNEKVDANLVETIKNKLIYKPTGEAVKQEIKRRENGTPVVVSSVRNSLIDFEKQDKQDRSVEIMVLNAFSSDLQVEKIIYNSMAAITTAQNLIKKGFRVKITALKVIENKKTTYFHFVPAKRFNQPLDINAAAYVCGDPRFYRYAGFKLNIMGCDRNNEIISEGLGSPVNSLRFVSNTIEKDYVPNSNLKQADTRLYFGGSRNMNDVKNEVNTAIEILKEKYAAN